MAVLKNPRHERFAQELAKGKTADEAYVIAGYKKNDGNAVRLKGNERILARVSDIQSLAADKTVVTIESLTTELELARAQAMAQGQNAAAVSASMGKAKLHGFLVEKREHSGPNGGPIQTEEVSARDVLADRLAGIAARNGKGGDPK